VGQDRAYPPSTAAQPKPCSRPGLQRSLARTSGPNNTGAATFKRIPDHRTAKIRRHSRSDRPRSTPYYAYPLPQVTATLDKLRGARYLSTLDLKNGYWQVPLAPESRPITAFTIPGKGLMQFRVMPFGLHSAPATFQRLLDKVLGPELERTSIPGRHYHCQPNFRRTPPPPSRGISTPAGSQTPDKPRKVLLLSDPVTLPRTRGGPPWNPDRPV